MLRTVSLILLLNASTALHADWVVKPRTEWSEEARAWNSLPVKDLYFDWALSEAGKNLGKEETDAQGAIQGHGTLTWYTSREAMLQRTPGQEIYYAIYTGDMLEGKRSGYGRWYPKSGAKYEGQWQDDMRQGLGTYYYANGDVYEGEFHQNLMHGQGRLISANGRVYIGGFANDKMDGPGTLTYPDGRVITSTWSAGKNTTPEPAPASKSAYITVSADTPQFALNNSRLSLLDAPNADSFVTYRSKLNDGTVEFTPDWPYWRLWKSGGPVGDRSDVEFWIPGLHPAYIQVRVFNETSSRLVISEAELVVEQSTPDTEPLFVIGDLEMGSDPHRASPTIALRNLTLNPCTGARVRYNILPPKGAEDHSNYPYTTTVAAFDARGTIDLSEGMRKLGMDPEFFANYHRALLQSNDAGTPTPPHDAQAVAQAAGPLRNTEHGQIVQGLVCGELTYGWLDHEGAARESTVRFNIEQYFYYYQPPEGGEGVPENGVMDVQLRTSGANYIVPIDYSIVAEAGTNKRFSLRAAAPASSTHRFKIRLRTADGEELLSPPVSLHYLIGLSEDWTERLYPPQ